MCYALGRTSRSLPVASASAIASAIAAAPIAAATIAAAMQHYGLRLC